jgi:uncharacterized membrane protein
MTPIYRLWSRAWNRCALAWYRRARAEMDPLHKDLPHVILRINQLESE